MNSADLHTGSKVWLMNSDTTYKLSEQIATLKNIDFTLDGVGVSVKHEVVKTKNRTLDAVFIQINDVQVIFEVLELLTQLSPESALTYQKNITEKNKAYL